MRKASEEEESINISGEINENNNNHQPEERRNRKKEMKIIENGEGVISISRQSKENTKTSA